MTRTLSLVLALLAFTQALAGDFNPSATVVVNGKNTGVTNLEYSRWSLDNCKRNVDWNHVGTEVQLACTIDTEGDGNEGSPTTITFTYHFIEISKKQTKLVKITTSQGHTLTASELENSALVLKGAIK